MWFYILCGILKDLGIEDCELYEDCDRDWKNWRWERWNWSGKIKVVEMREDRFLWFLIMWGLNLVKIKFLLFVLYLFRRCLLDVMMVYL